MFSINTYWMKKSDQWLLVPSIRITVEKFCDSRFYFRPVKMYVLGFEIGFINRWCAIEIKKEVTHG